MKQTTNKAQREYMAAKAHVEALEERKKQMERAYISVHGIVNPDGGVPDRIFCIEDEAVFNKANEESSAEMAVCGLAEECDAARSVLQAAENRLIEYGLSLSPASVRETLKQGAKVRCDIRMRLIEMASRLDVSTVPSGSVQGKKEDRRHD